MSVSKSAADYKYQTTFTQLQPPYYNLLNFNREKVYEFFSHVFGCLQEWLPHGESKIWNQHSQLAIRERGEEEESSAEDSDYSFEDLGLVPDYREDEVITDSDDDDNDDVFQDVDSDFFETTALQILGGLKDVYRPIDEVGREVVESRPVRACMSAGDAPADVPPRDMWAARDRCSVSYRHICTSELGVGPLRDVGCVTSRVDDTHSDRRAEAQLPLGGVELREQLQDLQANKLRRLKNWLLQLPQMLTFSALQQSVRQGIKMCTLPNIMQCFRQGLTMLTFSALQQSVRQGIKMCTLPNIMQCFRQGLTMLTFPALQLRLRQSFKMCTLPNIMQCFRQGLTMLTFPALHQRVRQGLKMCTLPNMMQCFRQGPTMLKQCAAQGLKKRLMSVRQGYLLAPLLFLMFTYVTDTYELLLLLIDMFIVPELPIIGFTLAAIFAALAVLYRRRYLNVMKQMNQI